MTTMTFLPEGRRLALAAGIALCLGLPAAQDAAAQDRMFCGERDKIVADLARKYGETRRSYGLSRSQGVIEVYASESGSWTILITRRDGLSCLMAAGEAYEAEVAAAPETPI